MNFFFLISSRIRSTVISSSLSTSISSNKSASVSAWGIVSISGNMAFMLSSSGKYSRDWQFSWECLHKKKHDGDGERYFVYVLEAALVLGNGVSLPFMSEFLDNGEYDFSDENKKQDCYTDIRFIPMFGNMIQQPMNIMVLAASSRKHRDKNSIVAIIYLRE